MPTPEELEAPQRISEAHTRLIDIGVAQNVYNELCDTARTEIRNILMRFPNKPLEGIEFALHDLWYTIIQAAIITPARKPAQDRLVAEVVLARELGSLGPNAMTADGELWSGLPFLAGDLSVAWLEKLMQLNTKGRFNLAAFTARLVAMGVRAPQLGFCAVFVLRETLETPRPLKVTEGGESGTSVADLLPAAVAWFEFAGHRLAVFSGGNGHKPLSGVEGELTAVGQLARKAGILEPGFSTKRWHFWLKRLKELSSDDDDHIREQAELAKNSMVMWSKCVGLKVK